MSDACLYASNGEGTYIFVTRGAPPGCRFAWPRRPPQGWPSVRRVRLGRERGPRRRHYRREPEPEWVAYCENCGKHVGFHE